MNLIKLHKTKSKTKQPKSMWQCIITIATLEVSGHPELLLNMGVDMSELISMDISGPLLTHEGMDNFISQWYGRYLKDYENN